MGGGSIFDLGCYTLSFLQILTNLDKLEIFYKKLYHGYKNVDVEAKIGLQTSNIKAYLHCSFLETLDQIVSIRGSEGDITIKNL